MTSNTFVKNVEHESAIKHVTGRAIYTDDISEPRNLLHAAIGFSPVSKGIIEKIDFSEVLKSDGVVDIITEGDIEGQNDVCLLYTSPSPRDATLSRMPSSA